MHTHKVFSSWYTYTATHGQIAHTVYIYIYMLKGIYVISNFAKIAVVIEKNIHEISVFCSIQELSDNM